MTSDERRIDSAPVPLPIPDADTRAFWDGCHEHQLRGQQCSSCGRFRWPPQEFCPGCYSWEYAWVPLTGQGRVQTYTIVHYAVVPAFAERLPYVVAVVTLDGTEEKMHFTSNVVGCPTQDVHVDMRVEVVFQDVTPDVTLPLFQPVPGASVAEAAAG